MLLHADSEDADQTVRRSESSLGAHVSLLDFSCGGSFIKDRHNNDEVAAVATKKFFICFADLFKKQ